jgi:peroxin-3
MCMFLFGLVTVCQGLVTNWAGLMTTRWFLGMRLFFIIDHF